MEDVAMVRGGLTQRKPCVLDVEIRARKNERGLPKYRGVLILVLDLEK